MAMVGGPIREIKIPVQELWLKTRGGLYARGAYMWVYYITSYLFTHPIVFAVYTLPMMVQVVMALKGSTYSQ